MPFLLRPFYIVREQPAIEDVLIDELIDAFSNDYAPFRERLPAILHSPNCYRRPRTNTFRAKERLYPYEFKRPFTLTYKNEVANPQQWVRILSTGEIDPNDVKVRVKDDRIFVEGAMAGSKDDRIFFRRELHAPSDADLSNLRAAVGDGNTVVLSMPLLKSSTSPSNKGKCHTQLDCGQKLEKESEQKDAALKEKNEQRRMTIDIPIIHRSSTSSVAVNDNVQNETSRPVTSRTSANQDIEMVCCTLANQDGELETGVPKEPESSSQTSDDRTATTADTDMTSSKKDEPLSIKVNTADFSPESVNVEVKGRTVTLRAQYDERKENSVSSKRFVRQLLLPTDVDSESVTCSYDDDGTLTLTAQKKEALSCEPLIYGNEPALVNANAA